LARELHDVVAHHVAGIVIQAQAARLVASKRPETLDDRVAGIESVGNDALAAIRRVVSLLRDPDGEPTPGHALHKRYCRKLRTGRRLRKSRWLTRSGHGAVVRNMTMIGQRPAEVETRQQAGHWDA
jgi:hypothetical protein